MTTHGPTVEEILKIQGIIANYLRATKRLLTDKEAAPPPPKTRKTTRVIQIDPGILQEFQTAHRMDEIKGEDVLALLHGWSKRMHALAFTNRERVHRNKALRAHVTEVYNLVDTCYNKIFGAINKKR
jgi:hypothetical protein